MTKKTRTGVVYMATVDRKSYVGQAVDFNIRKYQHLWHSKNGSDFHFHRVIRKHGADSVRWKILEDNIPDSQLNEREKFWIEFYDTYNNGYNMTEGGEDAPSKSPEVAAKISATHRAQLKRGEHHSQNPEFAAKISATRKAMGARGELPTQNPEIAAKISATQKAQVLRGEHHTQQTGTRLNMRKKWVKKNLKKRREAGQEFFLDMDLED